MTAEVLASELGLPLAVVRIDSVVSSYLGETASNLRQVFDFIASIPMVALFDEFDALAKERADSVDHWWCGLVLFERAIPCRGH
uniref:ATPase family associated with various cellular activities (AAA) n=1 Tax=Candidatus Kentrum sp. TUN TaxID=2126343 RepID=A0A451AG99_9GAMM|nr:MAG: ATPase family associated with various cellular activities (AAA) [Candidatus Kentron sp. TUN]